MVYWIKHSIKIERSEQLENTGQAIYHRCKSEPSEMRRENGFWGI
jgi:hypothetical protein